MTRAPTDRSPSELHAAGYGHVPVALLRDDRADAWDIALYAAISSALTFRTGEGQVREARLSERAHMGRKAVRAHTARLVAMGYLRVDSTPGQANRYRLRATPEVNVSREQIADAEALDPRATGQRGGTAKGKGRTPGRVGPSKGKGLR